MARLPRDVQKLLDKLEPALREAFLAAVDQLANAAEFNRLIAALEAGDIADALEALRLEAAFFSPVDQAIGTSFAAAGQAALGLLRIKDPYTGDAVRLAFDGRHDRAETWVRDRSSELIVEIVDDQRRMARDVIERGLIAGQNPKAVALDIVGRIDRVSGRRKGGFIGLTSQQAQWAKNAERELRDLDASYFTRVRRDKRFDATVRAAIDSGKPLAEADVRRIITRYRDRLLKYRGDVIGRTEALNSLRAGQHEGFAQLVDSGKVRADQITVVWGATMDVRTRDSHRHMNGATVTFGGLFDVAPGVQMQFPGDLEHSVDAKRLAAETIQCRCLASYRVQSDMLRRPGERRKPAPTPATPPQAAPTPKPQTVPTPAPVAPLAASAVNVKPRSNAEKAFLKHLELQGDAAGAFMATTPPAFVASSRGYYQPGKHEVHQRLTPNDRKGDQEHQGRKWIGTFAHEYGHAIDFDGFGMANFPRSAAMLPAMVQDRAALIAERHRGQVTADMRKTAAEIAGQDGADRFADLWQAGKLTEALGALNQGLQQEYTARGYMPTREMFLDHYSIGNLLDFIGAVTDLEKGAGHSKAYYRQFKAYDAGGDYFTTGHTTEAFANAFMAHTLPRRAFLEALLEQAAPRTVAAFRAILKERAQDAAITG